MEIEQQESTLPATDVRLLATDYFLDGVAGTPDSWDVVRLVFRGKDPMTKESVYDTLTLSRAELCAIIPLLALCEESGKSA